MTDREWTFTDGSEDALTDEEWEKERKAWGEDEAACEDLVDEGMMNYVRERYGR